MTVAKSWSPYSGFPALLFFHDLHLVPQLFPFELLTSGDSGHLHGSPGTSSCHFYVTSSSLDLRVHHPHVLSCPPVYFPGCDCHPSGSLGLRGNLSALGSSSLCSRALAFWEGTRSAVSLLLRAEELSWSFVMVSGQGFAWAVEPPGDILRRK